MVRSLLSSPEWHKDSTSNKTLCCYSCGSTEQPLLMRAWLLPLGGLCGLQCCLHQCQNWEVRVDLHYHGRCIWVVSTRAL